MKQGFKSRLLRLEQRGEERREERREKSAAAEDEGTGERTRRARQSLRLLRLEQEGAS